jgi:hypothetical protein
MFGRSVLELRCMLLLGAQPICSLDFILAVEDRF